MRERKRSATTRHATVSAVMAVAAADGAARLLSPRDRVQRPAPAELGAYFTAQQIDRARRFVRPQMALALARAAVDAAALALLVRRPPRILRRPPLPPVPSGALGGAAMAAALTVPSLPLAAVARRRAIAVGLVTQSWRGWAVDLLKHTAIEASFAAAAGGGAVALTRRYPTGWWAPAAAVSVVAGAGLAAAAPALLDPIFNDFTPLPAGQRRDDVLELAAAAGVTVGEVYSVDASRRTTAANAYVSGLGPTKRVVLFDTLLDRYSRDEVRVVVAHELAHVRHRDVARGVAYAALTAPAAALAVQRLSWTLSPERGTAAELPALALAAGILLAPVGLAGNRLSRAIERRADRMSLELTGAPEAFVSFERAITLQNVADPQPPRWITELLATHPQPANGSLRPSNT